jgi:hypothetical protein
MARVNRPKADGEGIGWLADYATTLVHWYPSFTREFVLDILPLSEGWMWYSAAVLNEPMNKFVGIKYVGSYVKQESEKLIEQDKLIWDKQN